MPAGLRQQTSLMRVCFKDYLYKGAYEILFALNESFWQLYSKAVTLMAQTGALN